MISRPLFLLPLALLAGLPAAGAATVWRTTGAQVDTVVADTATLAPLGTPIPFEGFRYPHVDDAENVTFIADDPAFLDDGKKGPNHGIYRSFRSDGHLQSLVFQNDLIPGTSVKYDFLRGLQVDEHGADFVFNATGDGNQRGLFLWSGGVVTALAREGVTRLPGEAGTLTDVHWGALHHGRVLYVAADEKRRAVLVLHEIKTGARRVLVRDGDPIPGHPGEIFHYVAHQNWLDADSIVFRGGSLDPYLPADPKRDTGKDCGGLYGWFDVRWDDPASFDQSRLVTLAETRTPAPALEGVQFTDIRSAPVHGDLVTFYATTDQGRGIYLWKKGEGLRLVADTQTRIDGLFKGAFSSFNVWPAAVDNGVVFTGSAGGVAGVYLYRADQDALYLLADSRTALEGKHARYFELGARPLVGNRFALTANFSDKSSGVYLATIPERAFKRINAAP